eukprot:CAMPEP_0184691322 /NCGR_PEP_ID=MMETSP0313-20130426/215_1 /TAXON_ID=2792 /ORGANISM="Porphyridium aerugineum, Strain SAG 1380-2" /LENGTH=619 /DNA_ID=CAMNT_0027149015 /DNA_START=186 /DNA_END=2045 /DNA_ORIENTATION=+
MTYAFDKLPDISIHTSELFIQNVEPNPGGDESLENAARILKDETDPVEIASAIKAIRTSTSPTAVLHPFISSGICTLIIHDMAKFMKHADVQTQAALWISHFLREVSSLAGELTKIDGVKVLMHSLMRWRENKVVIGALYGSLRFVAFNGANRLEMIKLKVIEIIAELIKTYTDPLLRLGAMSVLSNVSFGNVELKDKVGRTGVIDTLLASLEQHSEDPSYVVDLCQGLRNLVFGSKANQAFVKNCGGIEILVTVLEKYKDNAQVADALFAALGNILHDSIPNASAFCAVQGHQITYDIMNRNAQMWSLVDNALLVLANCSRVNIYSQSSAAIELLKLNALGFASNLLKDPDVPPTTIQKVFPFALALLTPFEGKENAREVKLLDVLVKSLTTYMDQVAFLKATLIALSSAVSGDDTNKVLTLQAGCLDVTLTVLEKYKKDAPVALQCLILFDSLFDNTESGTLFGKEESVVSAILDAMSLFADDPKIQEHACGALYKIGIWGEVSTERLSDPSVVRLVEQARNRHKGNYSVESLANQFLTVVVTDSNSRQGRSQTAGSGVGGQLRSRSRTLGSASARSRSRSVTKSRSPPRTRTRRTEMLMPGIAEEGESGEGVDVDN